MPRQWGGRAVTEARAWMATRLPAPCGRCSKAVTIEDEWVVGHIKSRAAYPELTWEPSNWHPEHKACSEGTGTAAIIEKAKRQALVEAGVFPHAPGAGQPPILPAHTHGALDEPLVTRDDLTWDNLCRNAPTWLKPYLDIPEDAAPPLWVSPVHPDAVGSYGPDAIEWMEANLKERGRPLRFRWWQRLAIVLQLQHRADGSLCFRVILESGPRRIGKSVRLRGMALWRLEHGADLFEDEQLVLHTGKDLAIVREIMRKAWPWADARDDWSIKKGMTEPEVARDVVNRWVARSQDSTTGYDACLVLVDEAWDVKPANIDDDVEPTMLERQSPQLLLTSTAHRRATSLMRGRIIDTLAVDDGETLLLLWGAPAGAEIGSPNVWRAASPHWSDDRAKMMASKHAKAMAGEADPEADDPDPIEGFKAQYLNMWHLGQRRRLKGRPLIEAAEWSALIVPIVATKPTAVAVESWFGEAVSVALSWLVDSKPVTTVFEAENLAAAVEAIEDTGYVGTLLVGASLAEDPALKHKRKKVMKGRVGSIVAELDRMLREDAFRHDGAELLRDQVLAIRTLAAADGSRLASNERADAVKAATWAATAARQRGNRSSRMVLPTSA